jgi:ABC-2 type transport system permease protein
MFAIFKKELRSYFMNAIGFVYLGVFFALSALLCCFSTLLAETPTYNTSGYFTYMTMAFIILIPLLTMKLFAEEKKLRTEQLLLTAPVSIWGMVFGKFLAAFTLFVGSVVVSCINYFPLISLALNEQASSTAGTHIGPIGGQVLGCLIGVLLIGAAFIAIGMFISSLCETQLAAAVISVSALAGLSLIGILTASISSEAVRNVLNWISVLSRFDNFALGLFDPAALLYYVSIAGVFIFLTVRIYEKRRWG